GLLLPLNHDRLIIDGLAPFGVVGDLPKLPPARPTRGTGARPAVLFCAGVGRVGGGAGVNHGDNQRAGGAASGRIVRLVAGRERDHLGRVVSVGIQAGRVARGDGFRAGMVDGTGAKASGVAAGHAADAVGDPVVNGV